MQIKFVLSLLIVAFSLSGCGGNQTEPMAEAPTQTAFKSFSSVKPNKEYEIPAMVLTKDSWWDNGTNISTGPNVDLNAAILTYFNSDGTLKSVSLKGSSSQKSVQPTDNLGAGYQIANPKYYGYEYQTFGIWWENTYALDYSLYRQVSFSTGHITEFNNIPTFGPRLFSGDYYGSSSSGASFMGTIGFGVDFTNRSIDLVISNAATHSPSRPPSSTNQYNMTGTLRWYDSNNFSGIVSGTTDTSLIGTAFGRFYGPSAEELGGVIQARNSTQDIMILFGAK